MNKLESTEGWRCSDGIYRVHYKLMDMFYFNYDTKTESFIYPNLQIGELHKARAVLMKWSENPNKIITMHIESPVFDPKHFSQHLVAMDLLGDSVAWAIKCHAEPRLIGKYITVDGKMTLNSEWEPVVAPKLIRDDSVLEMFDYRISDKIKCSKEEAS